MGYVIVLVALFGLMWFLLIRPQRRRGAEQLAMQDNLERRRRDPHRRRDSRHGQGDRGRHRPRRDRTGTLVRIDRRAVAAAGGTEETAEDEAKPEEERASLLAES